MINKLLFRLPRFIEVSLADFTTKSLEQDADVFTFIFKNLDVRRNGEHT